MTENLTEMIKESTAEEDIKQSEVEIEPVQTEEATSEPVQTEEATPIPQSVDSQVIPPTTCNLKTFDIISLSTWFDTYVNKFPNIRKPTVSIQGVDPVEQLIITVLASGSDEKRKLIVFDDAHKTPVLNLEPIDMRIYAVGFRIIYENIDGVYIKSYRVRTGLISVLCLDLEDIFIPFDIVRSKKHDSMVTIDLSSYDRDHIIEKMQQPVDRENLQLLYKQSAKAENLTTNLDAVKWLIERQGEIEDINHHLQIDNVIIDILL